MPFLTEHITAFSDSPLAALTEKTPWALTTNSLLAVRRLLSGISEDFRISGDVAVHPTATVEAGALIKAPAIIGPGCFIAAGSLIRGGCWLEENCIIGPGCELKSSFLFSGSKLAHFNFVGDSVVGARVNLEAGSIVANFRNEFADPKILILHAGEIIDTGVDKFGALIGDDCKFGANAVIAPGAIFERGAIIARLALVDQRPR
ncbi:transferase hexapeptide (six repeat-containing protein) [Tardiphaga sp. OK246]|jgi:NDP-sugar pyrophosphorylase family protein|uniref:LpxA family transferase n=1 Tax=Tardiphaga sp. OK246 TaxID=1855307 RepID=UPI000B6918FA|nr:LpxA family transferase [Tardiphaga sp. OK246]SNT59417.1 transferase hexapeptide (six repeat-containing protein) [Tardiphaga sp. OK246]